MKVSYRFFSILTAALLSGFGLVCTGHQDVLAQTTSTKTVNGEISGLLNDSISVMYREDAATGQEFEVLFMVDETVQLVGKNTFKGFKVGEKVLATYTETVSIDENGNEIKDRQLVSIKFLQPAVADEPASEASESEESTSGSTLTSEQP